MQIFAVWAAKVLRSPTLRIPLKPQHGAEQTFYCGAAKLRKTCLSRNNVLVTLDHLETLLSAVPAGTAVD